MLLNLESVERKGKSYKNLNISRMKRAFSMKQKTFFIVFEGRKNKNFMKNSGHKLYIDKRYLFLSRYYKTCVDI